MLIQFGSKRINYTAHNDGLQLRRAISIQAEGKKLLEKHAIASSAARLCYAAPNESKATAIFLLHDP
jgi:hypothetical protein